MSAKLDAAPNKWQYQRMLKMAIPVKRLKDEAVESLLALLRQVEIIKSVEVYLNTHFADQEVDLLVELKVTNRRHSLICEIKANGQPRIVSSALLALRKLRARDSTPILIAPFLSEQTQQLCREERVGYMDLFGNAHIAFQGVFIERRAAGKPPSERRELRSLFSPKSARVLLVLLRDPGSAWKVADLARVAKISLGHVSNVRSALINQAWADVSVEGLRLTRPQELLETWTEHYQPPRGQSHLFYTALHGKQFDDAVRGALRTGETGERAIFASFSAANWLAPYARMPIHHFYADLAAIDVLSQKLRLTAASRGENVRILTPEDDGVFLDICEPSEGIVCTSPVRTYLDLKFSGERGEEAAEFLRREKLTWQR